MFAPASISKGIWGVFRRRRYPAVRLGGRDAFPRAIDRAVRCHSAAKASRPRSGRTSQRPGAVGWLHCVQYEELTQHTIDCRQTLIAFESMNLWSRTSSFKLHVFHKNNEIAGYCSVLHAMSIVGSSGIYGRRLRGAVIGFGATARGAVTALNAA